MLEGRDLGSSSLNVSTTLDKGLKLDYLKNENNTGSMEQKRQGEKVEKISTLGNWTYPWILVFSTVRWEAGPPQEFLLLCDPWLCCAVRTEWNDVCKTFLQSYSKLSIIIKAIFLDVLWNLYHSDFLTLYFIKIHM